jgi:putative glycosyltransferase (TIGR04372 family)
LEAKRLKLHNYKNTELILNKKDKVSNPELFKYFKNKIKIVYDHNLNGRERKIKTLTTIPVNYAIPIKKTFTQVHIATNIINNNKKNDKSYLKLSQKHKKVGNSYLKKIGLNKNDWFVTLHVREGSTKNDVNSESFRNGNIKDYYKAIKFIIAKGGYVFRMGDNSLSKLPRMKGVIDYANSEHRSQALDIFLGAKSKFCIATSSGYYIIPYLFGIPVLMTNSISSLEYWLLREKDFFLPKKIFDKSKNKTLNLLESLNPPYSIFNTDVNYFLKYLNIKILVNTSEEIYDSVKEVFEDIFYKKKTNNKINYNFKNLMSKKYLNFSNEKLYPLAKIPKKFLKKHI